MVQPAILPVKPAPSRSEKFEPGTQALRARFAHIKRELRNIQRLIARQAGTSKPPNKTKAPKY